MGCAAALIPYASKEIEMNLYDETDCLPHVKPAFHSITTLNEIRAHDPCREGWGKLLKHLGKTKADDEPLPLLTILESNGLDDALWCLRAASLERLSRHFQAWCAEHVAHHFEAERPDDTRVRDQIAMLRRDDATEAERDAASDAAWAAASDAAWAAASDAAWAAASDAASDAAWAAASDAAWAAASDAARAAARAAAWAAASDAASDAARAAARAAARDAARAAQERQLRLMIGGAA
jgi:hypothetical protein